MKLKAISDEIMHIKLLNVQGLAKTKLCKVENLVMNEYDIVCLTETQLKIDKVLISDHLKSYMSMRKENEQKGGGLLVIHKNNSEIEILQIQTKNTDIMHLSVKTGNLNCHLIVIYFSLSDLEKQVSMKAELNELIEKLKDQSLTIVGHMNGHVGFLGEQALDKNGQMIIDCLEKDNLILLNDEIKCDGFYTWQRQHQRSVIDYAICNQQLYTSFNSMKIDQQQLEIDISDHNLIDISLKTQVEIKNFGINSIWEVIE